MIKLKPCKVCSSTYHTGAFCPKKRKPIIRKAKVAKKAKRVSRKQLVKKLDQVFSLYIRQRDDGKGCVTCGDKKPIKDMQNCHFYSRGRLPTRWDETNCHSGCYRCNVLLRGNYIAYTMYMIDTYGREYVDELEAKSKSNEKITTVKIRELIDYYTLKVKS